MTNDVYSYFEVDKMGIKLASADEYVANDCIGTWEEEMEAKVVTKSCRGVVVKTTVRGTGAGTVNTSLHIKKAIYDQSLGMQLDSLIEGATAYGRNSRHEAFSITQHVVDEDGVPLYRAYPNCIIQTGKTSTVENGAEEVAEVELEISIMPDDFGNGVYEILESDLPTEGTLTAATFMTAFSPELMQADEA